MKEDSGPGLDQARDALRRLGYLDRRMERYLLQDAFRPDAPGRTVLVLLGKVVLLAALPAALLGALVVLALNGYFDPATPGASAWDLLPLFLHLLVPAVLAVGGSFLALAGLLVLLLRVLHRRRIETLSFALAALAAAATVLLLAWQGYGSWPSLPRPLALAALLALPAIAYGVLRLAHDGLLGLAIRLTDQAPEAPWRWGRALVGLLVALAFLVGLPAFLAVGQEFLPPPNLPIASHGEKVLLIGVDGVRAQELEFLLATGALPELERRREGGAATLFYPRPPLSPAGLWTSIATGVDAARHGLEAVDAYRPRGLGRPLLQGEWLRPYWRFSAEVGLAEYRAVLARERRVATVWDLLERGGLSTVVINWWGTFPVQPGAGHHLAHGAYQLLGDPRADRDAVAAPALWQAELAELRARSALPAELERGLGAAAGDLAPRLLADALLPDDFYRHALRSALAHDPAPRLAALYLPALDIAAAGLGERGEQALGSAAFAELLRWQLAALDELVAELAPRFDTVVLVFDGGRREPGSGAVWISRPEPCPEPARSTRPEAVAAAVLRALGLPQSAELPEPPAGCRWKQPPLHVETFGRLAPSRNAEVDSEEYLHSLRSLGYL